VVAHFVFYQTSDPGGVQALQPLTLKAPVLTAPLEGSSPLCTISTRKVLPVGRLLRRFACQVACLFMSSAFIR
jgi:hypothetical protein